MQLPVSVYFKKIQEEESSSLVGWSKRRKLELKLLRLFYMRKCDDKRRFVKLLWPSG